MEDKKNMEVRDSDNKTTEPTPGMYKVESVVLLESNFKRHSVNLEDKIIINEISIVPELHETTEDNKFAVSVLLDYEGKQNDLAICSSKIKMLGLFEKVGEPVLNIDSFKKINAPAIIYPFIREHLHNLCLKAGIANVLLPTVNFKV